jgi:hypothetical protein
MTNPWLKKNPFMSMWLSGANAAAGSLRGRAMGQAKRQSAAMMTKATQDVIDAWTAGFTAPTAPSRKRKRR